MAYEKKLFVKEKDGIIAPAGFHYMPNGKLMNDADHIAMHGYVEERISSFLLNIRDVAHSGEQRPFLVSGTSQAYFSIEIYDNSNNYYNFYTKSWSSTKTSLKNVQVGTGYEGFIFFPENTSSLKTYTVNLIAETVYNVKTSHGQFAPAFNADGSINTNLSQGSNSNIITKTIYQDVERSLFLSCIAPAFYDTSTDTVDGTTSSSNRVVLDNRPTEGGAAGTWGGVAVGDLVTSTDAAIGVWTILNKINPDNDNEKEIELNQTNSFTNGSTLTFTPPFNGVTPHGDESTSGRAVLPISSGGSLKAKFTIRITAPSGRLLSIKKIPSTDDLCTFKNVTFGAAALAIPGENTSGGAVFYRWPVVNISGLSNGMMLDPNREQSTKYGSFISDYETTETVQGFIKGEYNNDILYNKKILKDYVDAVDPYYNDITAIDRNGNATAVAGNLTFNKQQVDALKSDTNVRIFAHGGSQIATMNNGMQVKISDVELTPTQLSVVTSGATSSSTTIPIASTNDGVGSIVAGAEIRGININSAVANPTVVSKAAQFGAANIVVSSAQTLESGQTLMVDKVAKVILLTGTIEVSNFPIADTTIYFDLEKFITST